ncbi:MAG: hypothetical protein JXQ97_14660 [Natronospirillum sp.]
MKASDRLQLEYDLITALATCEEQALDAIGRADWASLAGLATELDRIAGDINKAMAQGFHSPDVATKLQRLLELYQKALLQAQGADNALKQQEKDLLQQRSDIATQILPEDSSPDS